jgi:hypothetical protein
MPTIFADIERDRHFNLINDYISKLSQRVLDFGYESQTHGILSRSVSVDEKSEVGSARTNPSTIKDSETIMEWMEISSLRGGLEAWKIQIRRLTEHVHELNRSWLDRNIIMSGQEVRMMAAYGSRIKERLLQIINEYDEKIRACSTAMDGMSFATQMVREPIVCLHLSVARLIGTRNGTKLGGLTQGPT